MADNLAESPGATEPLPAPNKVDIIQVPENKRVLINKALEQVDALNGDTGILRTKDQEFIKDVQTSGMRIHINAENANPRELGHRQVSEARNQVVVAVRSGLNQLSQQADTLGAGLGNSRLQIEDFLKAAAVETDPVKAYALAEQAMAEFNKTASTIEERRLAQEKAAGGIYGVSRQNEENANRLYTIIANQARDRLNEGAVFGHLIASRNFATSVDAAVKQLSTADRQFLERNRERKTIFQ